MSNYQEFLARKQKRATTDGPEIDQTEINPILHHWQNYIVRWAIKTRRAAIWADTGLGKTMMQLEWAKHSGDTALVVAPLAVCHQTVREAAKLGIAAEYIRNSDQITGPGMYVTNYENVPNINADQIDAVVLDESSILKQSDGKTRTMLIEHFQNVPARLACSATPAPNDPEELTNQAEFLGRMKRNFMLAAYFVHDQNNGAGWRLKGHAKVPMMQWMATWAVALRRPSDIGGVDDGYILPGLNIHSELVPVEIEQEGQLFATDIGGVSGRAKVRKETLAARCDRSLELVVSDSNWQQVCAKLAAWHGNQNMQPTGGKSTKKTPSIESEGNHRGDLPTPTANTCGSTTRKTKRNSSSTSAKTRNAETLDAANGTQPTPNTVQKCSDSPRNSATPKQYETTDCEKHSGSPLRNTMSSSNCKAVDAQSAETRSRTTEDEDSPLTTATTQGKSGESSAQNATSALESLRMIQSSWGEQSTICKNLEPWLLWVGTNDEQEYLAKAFGNLAFSVTGSMSPEDKADQLMRWADGERPVLITKPSIAGAGLNFQHCARMIFVGMGDSYEQYYQAIRRCYRYGQKRVVEVYIVLAEIESSIADNVRQKEQKHSEITTALIAEMKNTHQIGDTAA